MPSQVLCATRLLGLAAQLCPRELANARVALWPPADCLQQGWPLQTLHYPGGEKAGEKGLIQVTTPAEPQSPISSPERTSSSSLNTEGAPGQTPTQEGIGVQLRVGPAQQRRGAWGVPGEQGAILRPGSHHWRLQALLGGPSEPMLESNSIHLSQGAPLFQKHF